MGIHESQCFFLGKSFWKLIDFLQNKESSLVISENERKSND